MRVWLRVVASVSVAVGVAGCGQSSTAACPQDMSSKVAALEMEVAKLRAENEDLRTTAVALLAEVSAAVAADDASRAASAQTRLVAKFPDAPEAAKGAKQLADFQAARKAKEDESARLAALGFKGLRTSAALKGDDASIILKSTSISGQWSFDAYGDEWRYLESEKGQKYVTVKVSVSSQRKDPLLMGVAVYVAAGDRLRRIGLFDYRFARWDDYGSYLGNEADYRNDFAHSTNIPFSLGAAVNQDDISRPLYIVATKEGCFERSETRFERPAVSYIGRGCASLTQTLSIADFQRGRLAVLKRLD